MKFKVGDRIRYCNKNNENDGRVGVVIGVKNKNAPFSYYVSLGTDETKGVLWTWETCLEPYVETFRDRLKREHPEEMGKQYGGGCHGCPWDYGYDVKRTCDNISEISCRKCWDRPIPANTDINIYKPTNIITYKWSVCKCGDSICSDYKYCPHCGMKLDWSE